MPVDHKLEIAEPVEERLIAYAGKTGLEQSSTTPLVAAFRPIFAEARAALAAADGVAASVKDATCVSEIKQARACRLAIRKVRIAGEKVKKEQKAAALTYGRAVDGFYNILEADLAPVEKALQDAEDTAERAEIARKDAIESGRKAALAPFVQDVSLYTVRDMADAAFAALLSGAKLAKEQAEAAAANAEADRIDAEKQRAAEEARIKAENERLRKEAEAREEAMRQERLREQAAREVARQKAEADARAAAEVARKEREAVEEKARIERAQIEAKARAEREAAEAAAKKEREARQKAEAELQATRAAEVQRQKAAEAVARKAANAGDAAKLRTFADLIARSVPTFKNSSVGTSVSAKTSAFISSLKAEENKL